LSIEDFLYFECLFETLTGFVLNPFFIYFHFGKSLSRHFTSESLRYEEIAGFGRRDFDDISFASTVCHIHEEFYGGFCCSHGDIV
jgi:hypothetical protein